MTSSEQELEKTFTDPRYVRGVSLLKDKRYEEAIVVFSDLLRTMCEVEGKSDSLAVAPVYYEYGHALLSLTETSGNLFGGAVEDAASADDEEREAKEAADDLETAWEVMEVARVIYSRYRDDLAVETQLARVYTRLGDLSLESDQYEQAKADFHAALELRKKLLKATKAEDTTQLADLYCQLAIACLYRDSTQEEKEKKEESGEEKEEVGYYVKAGYIMAMNLHRIATKCDKKVQAFVNAWIPAYAMDESDTFEGKGKRKAPEKAPGTLKLMKSHPETLRSEFFTCLNVKEDEKDTLEKEHATLLEYLEIYVELKEKVDALQEATKTLKDEENEETSVTTVGFDQPSVATASVNVLPIKKRKTTSSPQDIK